MFLSLTPSGKCLLQISACITFVKQYRTSNTEHRMQKLNRENTSMFIISCSLFDIHCRSFFSNKKTPSVSGERFLFA